MNGEWKKVKLGEVIRLRKEFVLIDDQIEYTRPRVRLHAQGIVLRDCVPGALIKTKKQQVCRSGEFLVAEIDAKAGGFGIVPAELDGSIVSSHYFLYQVLDSRLNVRFLDFYVRTSGFMQQVEAQGTTNYAAIRPSDVLNYEIPLPPIAEQRRIVARIEGLAAQIAEARATRAIIADDQKSLLASAYNSIVWNAPSKPLNEVAPLCRRPALIEAGRDYPQVAVRSFGRGTFHKPPLSGSAITWEKPFMVRSGDILVSNIKAWEGAVAVATDEDDGRYGSHRYLTFVPQEHVATARFVCFHLLTAGGLTEIGEASPGTADRNRTLSVKKFLQISVPVPDYTKQVWFDSLCAQLDNLEAAQKETAAELDALMPSILDRAFKGEL